MTRPRPPRPVAVDAATLGRKIEQAFDGLSPELQRAARWVADHPSETGLLSMRQQARNADVSAPTMLRLARTLGFPDYPSLRRPFQEAMAGRAINYGQRASVLQARPLAARMDGVAIEVLDSQIADVKSVLELNSARQVESAVKAIARARRVGFLGVRASFGIAFQFRYAYGLIATNGLLLEGLGGTVIDQADALGPQDVLIAISQSPYSAPTVQTVDAAAARGVPVVALTDSSMSPLARKAICTLRFRTDSVSYFPSMIAPLALCELLLACLAAKGGKAVLDRLAEVEARLAAQRAYWHPNARKVNA